jgi:hypothetical protein
LREFEETEISRQSCRGDFSLEGGQEFGLCTQSCDYKLAYRIGIENNKRSKDVDKRTELETQLTSQMFRFRKEVQDLMQISTFLLVQRLNGTTAVLGYLEVNTNLPIRRLTSVRTVDPHWVE